MVAVLADYPDDVLERVVDPRSGLPSRMNWLPTIAEIKSACEDIYGPRRRIAEWDARAAKQITERKTLAITDGRTPEQIRAHRAAQVEDAMRHLGPGLRKGYARFDGDGKHAQRVAADLAMRKARHEAGNA